MQEQIYMVLPVCTGEGERTLLMVGVKTTFIYNAQ